MNVSQGSTPLPATMDIRGAVLEAPDARGDAAGEPRLGVVDLQLEGPGPGEILVRIEAAGVCHSDLSVINGSRPRPLPMLLGHEAAGRVTELGAGVTDLRAGQRVVMTFLPRCEECAGCATDGKLPCLKGSVANGNGTLLGGAIRLSRDGRPVRHHVGVSAFATHAVVDRHSVVAVDDDIPADVAALLGCAVLTGGGAVLNVLRPAPGDTVGIVGLGGVGMAALLTAVAAGARVVAVDALEEKLGLATELGAHEMYTPEQARDAGVRADLVVEAAGHARAFETAVALTAPGGTTVTVGLPGPDQMSEISPLTITAEARTIVGSYLGSSVPARDVPMFAQLWRDGRLPVERLISSHIGLEQINDAMRELAAGRAVRQMIMFN